MKGFNKLEVIDNSLIRKTANPYADRDRLKRELKISRKFRHRGLIRAIDWKKDEEIVIYYPYYRYPTLSQVIKEGIHRKRFSFLLKYIIRVLQESDLYHGDLNCQNILVTEDPENPVILIDFEFSTFGAKIEEDLHFLLSTCASLLELQPCRNYDFTLKTENISLWIKKII